MRRVAFLVFLPLLLLLGTAQPVAAKTHRPILTAGMSKSNNWSGYNQGQLMTGKSYHAISGTWVVPAATQRKVGEAEYSATWIGIGGGCLDAACTAADTTLIQAGTSQDVGATGAATYSVWWELIPAPSVTITTLAVNAGDTIHVDISEGAPELWTITVQNVTRSQTWTQTTPYSSTYATAEWIEETPVVVDNSGKASVGPMPNLATVNFDVGTVNHGAPGLASAQAIQLVDFNSAVLATPSAPDPDADGFNDCTYATSCGAPSSS
jgi:hypothetical protein